MRGAVWLVSRCVMGVVWQHVCCVACEKRRQKGSPRYLESGVLRRARAHSAGCADGFRPRVRDHACVLVRVQYVHVWLRFNLLNLSTGNAAEAST